MRLCGWTGLLVAATSPAAASAQDTTTAGRDSTAAATLPAVEVTVTRDAAAASLTAPYALSVIERSPLERRALMQDLLAAVPGLFVANRNNPTQDPRIVIRGFGARTAFGVRGVKVLHDGIPLTLPDGQTPVDFVPAEWVERIEVIRGSASSLYGNAAGGVVAFSSPPLGDAGTKAAVVGGSHGLVRYTARTGGSAGALDYAGGVSRTDEDGFREHSRQRVTRGTARMRYSSATSSITANLLAYHMPLAENPGALTATQLAADRSMADPLAVARGAGKRVSQTQLGLTYESRFSGGDLSVIAFGGRRLLDNPLPFAIIDLDRVTSGLVLRLSRAGMAGGGGRMTLGVDVQHQDDDRREYENCTGRPATTQRCTSLPAERGGLRRAQRELVSSIGPYASGAILFGRYRLSAGVRADAIVFDVRDRMTGADNPDESGRRTMRAVSPQLGLVAIIGPGTAAYASLSSAFETPTATELGNKPDGSAGVNHTLDPQRSTTVELGLKGDVRGLRYDAAVYHTAVRAELVPFEIAGGAGRRFFRNAGRTRRRGAEAAVARSVGPLELRSAASYSDFEFVDFRTGSDDFSGNTIPGVPARFGELSAIWSGAPVQIGVTGRFVSSILVDDANSARAPGYAIANVRAGASFDIGRAALSPVVAVDNLFGRAYVGAVSVNAAGGRYFEPAPGRTVTASVALTF